MPRGLFARVVWPRGILQFPGRIFWQIRAKIANRSIGIVRGKNQAPEQTTKVSVGPQVLWKLTFEFVDRSFD